MNSQDQIDCFDFYLWSIGELKLNPEPEDIHLMKEEYA